MPRYKRQENERRKTMKKLEPKTAWRTWAIIYGIWLVVTLTIAGLGWTGHLPSWLS